MLPVELDPGIGSRQCVISSSPHRADASARWHPAPARLREPESIVGPLLTPSALEINFRGGNEESMGLETTSQCVDRGTRSTSGSNAPHKIHDPGGIAS